MILPSARELRPYYHCLLDPTPDPDFCAQVENVVWKISAHALTNQDKLLAIISKLQKFAGKKPCKPQHWGHVKTFS